MTKKNTNNRFMIGIAVACVLPLSFYFIAKLLKKDHIIMPRHYMAEKVDSAVVDGKSGYDTTFH